MNTSDEKIDRQVIQELHSEPLSHNELSNKINVSWDTLQKSIRRLRNKNLVVIRLDRLYELNKK